MFDSFKTRQRLSEVEEGLEKLRRQFAQLDVSWMDTLDKLRTMMGRIVKDRERAERARAEMPDVEAAGVEPTPEANSLSTRQQQINAAILARRSRTQ